MSDSWTVSRQMAAALERQGVDAVYCINLPSRPDRRAFMEQKLSDVGLVDVRWWSATDGREPRFDRDFEVFWAQVLPTEVEMQGVTRGALGLMLTWRDWLDHVLSAGHRRVLLLEDDVYFHHDFVRRFADEVPRGSPIVYVGGHQCERCPMQQAAIDTGRALVPVSPEARVYGTFGLLMDADFLAGLHPTITDIMRWDGPIDAILWEHQRAFPAHRGCITHPPLVVPEVRESMNMGPRDLTTFADLRGLDFSAYGRVADYARFIRRTNP